METREGREGRLLAARGQAAARATGRLINDDGGGRSVLVTEASVFFIQRHERRLIAMSGKSLETSG